MSATCYGRDRTRGRAPRRGGIRRPAFEQLEPRRLLSATPSLGAIYWDGWFAGNTYQQELSPAQYQDRLPFYSTGYGTSSVTVVNDSQATMDQEIQYAKQAGLSYFAFDWYSPTNSFQGADDYNHGLYDYMNSQYKSQVNFCLLLQGGWLGGKANWSTTAQTLVNMMAQSTYQKAPGNRPLVYMYDISGLVSTFGSERGRGGRHDHAPQYGQGRRTGLALHRRPGLESQRRRQRGQ